MKPDDEGKGAGTWGQLRAIFRYEFLWNLRKKKVLAMFLIAIGLMSLTLFVPALIGDKESDPVFVLRNLGPNAFVMVLLAVAVSMNSISGEFEKGTVIPLASKPVSRKVIYLGKLLAMLTILLIVYSVLHSYMLLASRVMYGFQAGLNPTVVGLPFLTVLSTGVWVSIALLIGSGAKSSTMAAIGTIGLFFAVSIAGGMFTTFTSASGRPLNYIPGGGETGHITGDFTGKPAPENLSGSTGTDSIARNFLLYSNDPSARVVIERYRLSLENLENAPPAGMKEVTRTLPLSRALTRSIAIALAYLIFLNIFSLKLFERAEVTES